MCLAIPGEVISRVEDELVVDFQGSRVNVSAVMTPDVDVGDWVLVHAGFAISELEESEARRTWDYLQQAQDVRSGVDDGHHG